jgi:hypothetical protein
MNSALRTMSALEMPSMSRGAFHFTELLHDEAVTEA